MNDKQQRQLDEFSDFLKEEYEKYRQYEISMGRKAPTEEEFCARRLGIQQATYSRSKRALQPVGDFTLLTVAFNLGSIMPLKIFGKERLLADDPRALEIMTKIRRARPEVRESIAYLLTNDVTLEDLKVSPA